MSSNKTPCRIDNRLTHLVVTLYTYIFFNNCVLLYPVYALLFTQTGLKVEQISSLFVIWSVASFILDIPSSLWADTISRRIPLIAGPVLAASGFALWVLLPSYWIFAIGFLLWGAKEALVSGILEALIFEELDYLGKADLYARIMGRAKAIAMLSIILAIVVAAPVLHRWGYGGIGAASVAACLLASLVAVAFPHHRPLSPSCDSSSGTLFFATMRMGFSEARHNRSVQIALLMIPAIAGIWGSLEEYIPLLIQDTGVRESVIPLLILPVWIAVTAGGLLVGIGERMSMTGVAGVLAVGGLALAAGTIHFHPRGIILVAVSFGIFQMINVIVDARLQHRMTSSSRATVTSLVVVVTELVAIAVTVSYAFIARQTGYGTGFVFFAVFYIIIALLIKTIKMNRYYSNLS